MKWLKQAKPDMKDLKKNSYQECLRHVNRQYSQHVQHLLAKNKMWDVFVTSLSYICDIIVTAMPITDRFQNWSYKYFLL